MIQPDLPLSNGFGVHISMTSAVAIALAMVAQDRRFNGVPPLTATEIEALKVEHTRLVATFT